MHRLSGIWTSKVFNHASGSIPVEKDDGRFDLKIDDAGIVLAGSTHTRPDGTSKVITGRAEQTGLILEEAGTTLLFSGKVLVDGIFFKLLVGDAKIPGGQDVGQEEGTWVGTQP